MSPLDRPFITFISGL